MDDTTHSDYESRSQTIRAELKQWETSWAKTHEGKKPSRDDIKQNPDIAQKYKSYNKLRDILSGKLPPPSKLTSTSPHRKRKSISSQSAHDPPAHTPSKRLRTTPSVTRTTYLPNDQSTPSLSRRLFISPASAKAPTPTSIGPTPQRDGRVLGLFDLLSGTEETPSRARTGDFIGDESLSAQLAATPRKDPSDQQEHRSGSTTTPAHRHGRTPMSTSKRAMLDNFLLFTPLKNRSGNAGASFASRIGIAATVVATDKENGVSLATTTTTTTPKGPQSASRCLFATPAFLKRGGHKPLDPVDEDAAGVEEVRPLRLPRKPLVRGLSSVVAGLRKLEEERLDDEMEAMREAEMEVEGYPVPPPAKKQRVDGRTAVEREDGDGVVPVEVEDSQVRDKPVLLGGFDDEDLLDSDVEEQLDRGQPLRVFKKKGQKRTTRRVNMKPTRARRPATQPGEGESEEEEEVVPETQLDATKVDREDDFELLSGSDFEEDEDPPRNKAKAKTGKDKKNKDGKGGEEKEGTVKKAVRKVKATAHANFKRLKLKNHGAKGGPGVNSRFRRRR